MRVLPKSIICTTDFSDSSNHALTYGVALAKEFDAKLYLCHVIDLPSTGVYGDAITYPGGQQDKVISYTHGYLRKLIGDTPVDWEPLVTLGHGATEIVRFAKEKRADLVISSTHGRTGWKRFVLGSVTGHLIRTLSCPLLVVRSPAHDFVAPANQEIKLQRILVGCDFSPDSNLAFQYGLSLAQEFQSELHMAHVLEPPVYRDLLKREATPEEEFQHDLRSLLKERLTKMIPEEAFNWCSPSTVLLAGQPHEELTKYALVNEFDLIVLGLRGHSLVETLFVGSTSDRVLRRASCPVLLVRPVTQIA